MGLACKTVPRLFLMSDSFILTGRRVASESQTRPVAAGQPTHTRELEMRHLSFTSAKVNVNNVFRRIFTILIQLTRFSPLFRMRQRQQKKIVVEGAHFYFYLFSPSLYISVTNLPNISSVHVKFTAPVNKNHH